MPKRNEVVLSSLDEFQSEKKSRTIYSGVWCNKNHDINSSTYPHPYLNNDNWNKGVASSRSSYEEVMLIVSNILDDHFNSAYGLKFWEHILGWFILLQAETAIERYDLFSSILKNYPSAVFIGMHESDFERSTDIKNFNQSLRFSDEANLQLSTQVLKHIGASLDNRRLAPPSKGKGFNKQYFEKSISSSEAPKINSVVLYKTLLRKRARFLLKLIFNKKITFLDDMHINVKEENINKSLRRKIRNAECNSDKSKLVLDLLSQNLPKELIEEFTQRSVILKKIKYPKKIVTGLGSFWDINFGIWSAFARLNGSSYIGLQHGGTYGERKHSTFEYYERKVSDKYLTWGWKYSDNDIPFISVRLLGIRKIKFKKASKKILWIGTSDSKYFYILGPKPLGSQLLNYQEEQIIFHSKLSKDAKSITVFRPYPSSFNWLFNKNIKSIFKDIKIDDHRKTLHKHFKDSSLIVIDHIGSTSALEALKAGKPTIIFSSSKIFEIEDRALPIYKSLEEQGIFHTSAQSAANLVNNIHSDVEKWWLEPDRQKAVLLFMNKFANTKNQLSKWNSLISYKR